MQKIVRIATLCLVAVLLLSGCGMLKKLGFGDKDTEELTPVSSIAMGEEEARSLSDKVPVHLYFAGTDNSKLRMEVRYIPISEAARSVNHLAAIIVEELIKGPKGTGLKATIPEGTKLLPPVIIDSGVATVNLSKEFIEKHPGGQNAERMTIYSIVNSLTELKDVEKVSFLIEGQKKKDLKGSFALDMPFPRSISLISMEPAPQSSPAGKSGTDNQDKDKQGASDVKKDDTTQKDGTGKQDTDKPGTTGINEADEGDVSYDRLIDEETGEILE